MSQQTLDFYPHVPGWKARDTSKQAAKDIKPVAETLRQMVYAVLRSREASADEVAAILEIDRLSIRPRLSELAKRNRIFDTGKRTLNASGKRAVVWSAR